MAADSARYTKVAIILHWLIALLVIGQLAGGLFMVEIPKEEAELRFELFQLHKSFGILILLLTFARIAWRLGHPVPPLPAGMAAWERLAMRAAHAGFYVLLLLVPFLGWAYVSAAPLKVPTMLFGLVELPKLPFLSGLGHDGAEIFEEGHEIGAKVMIGLIILHIAAALKHHFVNRDDVLVRMAPMLGKK